MEQLNKMFDTKIIFNEPVSKVINNNEFKKKYYDLNKQRFSMVEMKIRGECYGSSMLIMKNTDASSLIKYLFKKQTYTYNQEEDLRPGTICEITNLIFNSLLGEYSNRYKVNIYFTVPEYFEGLFGEQLDVIDDYKSKYMLISEIDYSTESKEMSKKILLKLTINDRKK